jgi:hypothetical protein
MPASGALGLQVPLSAARGGLMSIPNGELEKLRERAAAMIATQQLPTAACTTILAGHGTGALCGLCGQPVNPTQIQYELADSRGSVGTRMHLWCHQAWCMELANTSA